MLLGKKLLLGKVTPYMFIYPFVTSGGRRQSFTDYYITKDGGSLTAGSFPVARVWFKPCYAHSMYLTVSYENSSAEVYTSGDGISWDLTATLSGFNPAQLLLAGEWFYLFESLGPIMRSRDGVVWTSVGTCPISITSAAGAIAYKDGTFVAATSTNFVATVYYSVDDCATWNNAATPPSCAPQYGQLAMLGVWAIDSGFVAEYENYGSRPGQSVTISGGNYKIFFSENGSVWTTDAVHSFSAPDHVPSSLYSNGHTAFYTATGYSGASGYKTSDGVTWEPFLFSAYVWRNANTGGNNRYLCQSGWESNTLTLSVIEVGTGNTYQTAFPDIISTHKITNNNTW